ncbi:acetate kinase [Marinibactrum halimedae]|uniref:Acetate kinase n=1 Tax=Marinibactrum halimedae TaxID=1444977 RepID=A0AA37WQF7_9GAMM|nr:acetate kinase [Marinibactrum halimedae]MCD9458215.1 acetate kinase [Marinibactrum halimedae]GLS27157.1 acetate kinase [Marinibactrum halimedae]
MNKMVLVLNCGSSSIKFAIIEAATGDAALSGLAESLGNDDAKLTIKVNGEKKACPIDANATHQQALNAIELALEAYQELQNSLVAVGHRVVHGGETFTQSVLINDDVKSAIRETAHMAPLHNPANLSGIESAEAAFPNLPHVAVFDTAFFQTMPKHAYLYALPYELYQKHGIRRYGFHGSSHYFVSHKAAEMLSKPYEQCNLITAHLGNGCSIASIHQGRAVDTSLGFTPLEGLVMGTRCGDIDPSLPTFLIEQLGYSEKAVTAMLNKESGLLGISQLSNDCRTLEEQAEQGHELANLALTIFSYRLAKYIGSYLVSAGPLDALVFTGGIGENSDRLRADTLKYLSHLGFAVDADKNTAMRFGQSGPIHQEGSHNTLVIATNEEWVIAQDAMQYV